MRIKQNKGFTMIEIMIVVVIVAIISAVAVPSYMSYVERTKRGDAMSGLMLLAQAMERFKQNNNFRYKQAAGAALGAGDPCLTAASGCTVMFTNQIPFDAADPYYTLTMAVTPTTYTLTATPTSGGSMDGKDTNLTLSSEGLKTWTDKSSALHNCWPKSGGDC